MLTLIHIGNSSGEVYSFKIDGSILARWLTNGGGSLMGWLAYLNLTQTWRAKHQLCEETLQNADHETTTQYNCLVSSTIWLAKTPGVIFDCDDILI
jgi:hypothetical protein